MLFYFCSYTQSLMGSVCLSNIAVKVSYINLRDPSYNHPKGRGGLVVRSRPWGRRVPGSKPDSTADPSCMGPVAR
ncbi:hypothetical protein AVEN_238463-1, partial [Araneus ventricosus]